MYIIFKNILSIFRRKPKEHKAEKTKSFEKCKNPIRKVNDAPSEGAIIVDFNPDSEFMNRTKSKRQYNIQELIVKKKLLKERAQREKDDKYNKIKNQFDLLKQEIKKLSDNIDDI